jgi:hypothetical protein
MRYKPGIPRLKEDMRGPQVQMQKRWSSRSLTNGWRSPRGRRQRRLPCAVVIDSPSPTGVVVIFVVNRHPLSSSCGRSRCRLQRRHFVVALVVGVVAIAASCRGDQSAVMGRRRLRTPGLVVARATMLMGVWQLSSRGGPRERGGETAVSCPVYAQGKA